MRTFTKGLLLAALLVAASVFAASADCRGDFNGDGVIDEADYEILKAAMGAEEGDVDYAPHIDLDDDGVIGGTDFFALHSASADGC
jgi:hypothetical protein